MMICSHPNNVFTFVHISNVYVYFLCIMLLLLFLCYFSNPVFLIQINKVSFHPLSVAVCIQFKVLVLVC